MKQHEGKYSLAACVTKFELTRDKVTPEVDVGEIFR